MKKLVKIFCSILFVITLLNASIISQKGTLKPTGLKKAGMSEDMPGKIDKVINKAIEDKETPGAVILVGRKGKIVYKKSYGYKQIIPEKIKMTTETIFDIASVTKPIATGSCIMKLIEDGEIRLVDNVSKYIPEFLSYSDKNIKKSKSVKIYHLLTHTSGLPPYTSAKDLENKFGNPCPEELIHTIATMKKIYPPGEHFTYSCLGFITLSEIVKRISGMTVDEFSRNKIFEPLSMKYTFYNPDEKFKTMIAPTEVFDGVPLIGSVHDPLAKLMDGKSGNAGLFSNADDMAIFAQMLLNGGVYNGVRIFSPLTVKKMTSVYNKTSFSGRGLSWDILSDYSSNLGDVFSENSYGHTGFTGTSICIDPETETFIILLTNRVHIDGGSVISLRGKIANIVAGSIIKE